MTFLPKAGDKFTVNVSGRFADEAPDNDSDSTSVTFHRSCSRIAK